MLSVVLLAALCSVAYAVPPVWNPSGCGISKYPDAGETQGLPPSRIVGGVQARPYEFPWQTSVRRKATNSHFCGGSIINQNWILCAAHCMDGETPGAVSIVVGEYDSSASSSVRVTLNVASIFVHENYNSRTMQNDVSLIKVSTPITFTEDIQPICAPEPTDDYHYRKCQCSGWGTVNSGGVCCPAILRYVEMNVTTNAYCQSIYTRDTIYDDMICATDNTGSNERDSCQGDSGGPLSIKETDGTFRSVGIVSWGIGCASGYPGVYTRVTYHVDWITNTINNN